jgi:hypothetical protein
MSHIDSGTDVEDLPGGDGAVAAHQVGHLVDRQLVPLLAGQQLQSVGAGQGLALMRLRGNPQGCSVKVPTWCLELNGPFRLLLTVS